MVKLGFQPASYDARADMLNHQLPGPQFKLPLIVSAALGLEKSESQHLYAFRPMLL